jgi:hypothetical protein
MSYANTSPLLFLHPCNITSLVLIRCQPMNDVQLQLFIIWLIVYSTLLSSLSFWAISITASPKQTTFPLLKIMAIVRTLQGRFSTCTKYSKQGHQ